MKYSKPPDSTSVPSQLHPLQQEEDKALCLTCPHMVWGHSQVLPANPVQQGENPSPNLAVPSVRGLTHQVIAKGMEVIAEGKTCREFVLQKVKAASKCSKCVEHRRPFSPESEGLALKYQDLNLIKKQRRPEQDQSLMTTHWALHPCSAGGGTTWRWVLREDGTLGHKEQNWDVSRDS